MRTSSPSPTHRKRRAVGIAVAAAAALVATATVAAARQYPGRGETGWTYASKRDCCDEAIARAQQDSAAICENVGGIPSPMRGGVQRRGSCAWESTRDDAGDVLFRCQAEATVLCR
jgi:hypothetical protein